MESVQSAALIGWQQGIQNLKSVLTAGGPRAWREITKLAHGRAYSIGQTRQQVVEKLRHGQHELPAVPAEAPPSAAAQK